MSNRTVISTLTVLAVLTAGALTAPLPASAAGDAESTSVVLRDGTGDAWTTPDGDEADYRLAPAIRNGDITVARLAHRARTVTVRIRYAELRRKPTWQFGSIVKTPGGDWFTSVTATRRRPAGRMELWKPGGDRATCTSMSHRIDYDRNLVVLRLPRRCVDRPDWVRLVVESYWVDDRRSVIDNPHNRKPKPERFSRRLYGP
jgi:hypothetical protein